MISRPEIKYVRYVFFAQSSVSSQLIDRSSISSRLIENLNASIHLRALLTDLFLIDEVLKLQVGEEKSLTTPTEP